MTISVGTRLGPYEILAPIGAGGMGEVYRAKDARLGRDVALKVLPTEVARDADRRSRFELEARAASALAHPNIVAIYDVGESDDSVWIAMELVEGRTVRELLASGPLPARRALEIGTQVAEGLAAAHAAGIVHRDLKPENLILSKDGFVKILDFGLAKLAERGIAAAEGPTVSAGTPGTEPGVVMGTVGYMSPEQAAGQAVDFRSDQFSFGSILYEIATGQRAFQRKTGVETLAAILREEPKPIAELNPGAPAPLRWTIERCLAKEREGRYESTLDLARELHSMKDHASEIGSPANVGVESQPAKPRVPGQGWLAAFAVLALVASAAILLAVRWHSPKPLPTFKRLTFQRGHITGARFASDSQTVIYSAAWDGRPSEIFSTLISRPESRSLGVSPAQVVAVADNGEMALILIDWISNDATFVSGTLALMPTSGGAPRKIRESVSSADLSRDGKVIAAVVSSLSTIKERDSLEFPLGTRIASGFLAHPRISMDGRQVAIRSFDKHAVRVALFGRDGSQRALSDGWRSVTGPVWGRNDEEVWFSASQDRQPRTLYGVSVSGQMREVFRIPAILDVKDVARDGKALILCVDSRTEMCFLPSEGSVQRNLSWFEKSSVAGISADGRTILFTERGGAGVQPAVYIRGTDGAPPVRLGDGLADSLSPEGKFAVAVPFPPVSTFTLLPTGSGPSRSIEVGPGRFHTVAGWSPDGKRLLFWAFSTDGVDQLHELDLVSGEHRPLKDIHANLGGPLSPDGRSVVVHDEGAPYWKIRSLLDGTSRPIPGTSDHQGILGWGLDGRAIFITDTRSPFRVSLLHLSNGRIETWKDFAPSDPAGVFGEPTVVLSPRAGALVYSYDRVLSELYLVEGLQ